MKSTFSSFCAEEKTSLTWLFFVEVSLLHWELHCILYSWIMVLGWPVLSSSLIHEVLLTVGHSFHPQAHSPSLRWDYICDVVKMAVINHDCSFMNGSHSVLLVI